MRLVSELVWTELETSVELHEVAYLADVVVNSIEITTIHSHTIRNRRSAMAAAAKGGRSARAGCPVAKDTGQWLRVNNHRGLNPKEKDWTHVQLGYGAYAIPQFAPSAMVKNLHFLCGNNSRISQMYAPWGGHNGFLLIYELLQGRLKTKGLVGRVARPAHAASVKEVQFAYALITALLHHDFSSTSFMPSLLRVIYFSGPQVCSALPKLKDDRDVKNNMFKTWPDENETKCPLLDLLRGTVAVVEQSAHILRAQSPLPKFLLFPRSSQISPIPSSLGFAGFGDTVGCRVTNYACNLRKVLNFSSEALPLDAMGISEEAADPENQNIYHSLVRLMRADDLPTLCNKPLADICDSGVYTITRKKQEISSKLPFNVSEHPLAQAHVARSLVKRLEQDMCALSAASASSTSMDVRAPKHGEADKEVSKTLTEFCLEATKNPDAEERVDLALQFIDKLQEELNAIKERDSELVSLSIPLLTNAANYVGVGFGDDGDRRLAKSTFLLLRHSQLQTSLWFAVIVSSLLSQDEVGFSNWRRMNPFIDRSTYDKVLSFTARVLLHSNRVGHINRVIETCEDIHIILKGLKEAVGSKAENLYPASLAALQQKCEALGEALNSKRGYFHPMSAEEIAKVNGELHLAQKHYLARPAGVNADGWSFDPRFLVFEFTWNLVLRPRQVNLVNEFTRAVMEGEHASPSGGIVRQMIMGAGKTTVVGPLLCLMLADGVRKSLTTIVMPAALIEFSRSVLRRTFSSIITKRIFTLHFDRNDVLDPKLEKKLTAARDMAAIVVSTPSSVRSIMLKFVEILTDLGDPASRASKAHLRRQVRSGVNIMALWREGACLMDEVDVVLHPLKSELNFPIGAKERLDFYGDRWELPMHMMEAIFACSSAIQHMELASTRNVTSVDPSMEGDMILSRLQNEVEKAFKERFMQKNPHVVLLNEEFYHERVKPVIAEWLLLFFRNKKVSEALLPTDVALQYLCGNNDVAEEAMEEQSKRKDPIDQLSSNEKKMFNLGRDWCTVYLPHVLKKIDRVSFGIMTEEDRAQALERDPRFPPSRAKLAIPFVGKDVPSPASEFAHPDVTIGLTVLAYRYEGLRWSDFEEMMAYLQTNFSKEMGKKHARPTALQFAHWVVQAGGVVVGSYKEFDVHREMYGKGLDGSDASDCLLASSTASGQYILSSSGNEIDKSSGLRNRNSLLASRSGEDVLESSGHHSLGVIPVLPLHLLKRSTDSHMRPLFKLFRKSPSVITWYLEEFIFPNYMRHQLFKLSASGQELGGSMLFKSRVGFSGTPSDLMPKELGQCGFETTSEARIVHTLTSSRVVSSEKIEDGWTVESLLEAACRPQYRALIDTGALITGMSNKQVAEFIIKHTSSSRIKGVVFLDERDRKMVLVRQTMRAVELDDSGIGPEQRYAFYDQIHTTGMDIKHAHNAVAVLTLGKDMVLRDYGQGAYRMRGIGKGQRIHLLIIPEVHELLHRELRLANSVDVGGPGKEEGKSLREVMAWLVINTFKSERLQHNQLQLQDIANIWRLRAFQRCLSEYGSLCYEMPTKAQQDPSYRQLLRSLGCFRETIDFSVEASVPRESIAFVDAISGMMEQNGDLMETDEDRACAQSILDGVQQQIIEARDRADVAFASVGTLEQEQEREQEQEQEQEQEIEIEKFQDLAYSRDDEEPIPWTIRSLSKEGAKEAYEEARKAIEEGTAMDVSADVELPTVPPPDDWSGVSLPPQFYPARQFHLHHRLPFPLPEDLLMSVNYFNPKWSGPRRLKNVVCVLEWCPDTHSLKLDTRSLSDVIHDERMRDTCQSTLGRVLNILDPNGRKEYPVDTCRRLVGANYAIEDLLDDGPGGAGDVEDGMEEAEGTVVEAAQNAVERVELTPNARISAEKLKELLWSNGTLRAKHRGRYFVLLSLAEGAGLRRTMHLLQNTSQSSSEAAVTNNAVLSNVGVCLTTLPLALSPLDTNRAHTPAPVYQSTVINQLLRFVDGDFFYSPEGINALLKSLQLASPAMRQVSVTLLC